MHHLLRRGVLPLVFGLVLVPVVPAQPDWTLDLAGLPTDLLIRGAAPGDQAGYSVAFGDVNGDGVADLVVGAPGVTVPGRTAAGAAYVFYGRRSFAGLATIDLATQKPDVTVLGEDQADFLGTRVATGDVNGDGRIDIVISGRGVDVGPRGETGGVYVIHGKPNLPSLIDLDTTRADLTIYGRTKFDETGGSLAVGDVNHDGVDDILAGAPNGDPADRNDAGTVHVFFGTSKLPSGAVLDLASRLADVTVHGRYQFTHLGASLTVGDFNNDGVDDLIIGSPYASQTKVRAGETYVVYGRVLWSTPFILDLGTGARPDFTVIGRASDDNLSTTVAVGDVNQDGKNDLLTTALAAGPGWPGPIRKSAGEANVIFGGTFGPAFTWDLGTTPPDIHVLGRAAGDHLGQGGVLADLDGDGVRDIIVAASDATPLSRTGAGMAFLFRGGKFGGKTTIDLSTANADWEILGAASPDHTGLDAVAAGDFNGDGYPDLALGTPSADFPSRLGAGGVRILYGGFARLLDPPKVGTRMRIKIRARSYPGTFRLGAAAFTGLTGIPVGTRRIPLDPDALFFTSLVATNVFQQFQGFLSGTGEADAAIAIPAIPGLAGFTIYSAFALLDTNAPSGMAASGNRLHITFVP